LTTAVRGTCEAVRRPHCDIGACRQEGLPLAPSALDSGSWGVIETEFGKAFGANMRAEFPGYSAFCDFTIGPELHVEIKGDTAWESPPMLEMAVQMFEESIERARAMASAMFEGFQKLDFNPLKNGS
jgi:hypothetical protein